MFHGGKFSQPTRSFLDVTRAWVNFFVALIWEEDRKKRAQPVMSSHAEALEDEDHDEASGMRSGYEGMTGSTISTLLHDKINPKDCQVLSLGDSGFLQFFRVVSRDHGIMAYHGNLRVPTPPRPCLPPRNSRP